MAENRRIVRVTRIVRSSIHGLLDQSQPFGRLALVHTLQAAGTACVTVSLAGSLFFSVSLHEAKGKVLLYLVLTIAPFALVGPALSPLLDRGRDARTNERRDLEPRVRSAQPLDGEGPARVASLSRGVRHPRPREAVSRRASGARSRDGGERRRPCEREREARRARFTGRIRRNTARHRISANRSGLDPCFWCS